MSPYDLFFVFVDVDRTTLILDLRPWVGSAGHDACQTGPNSARFTFDLFEAY
jgi:hypothetical protein